MKALLLLLGVVCAYVGCAYGIALPFSLRSGWIAQSSALQEDRVSFIVALPQRNLDVLNERFWAVSDPDHPDYQQFLEPEQIRDLIAADPAAVSKVRGWLLDGGVAEAAITSFGDALEVHTTVLVASRLFSADFYRLHHAETGRKVVRILGSWSLPEHLSSSIELVTGLWELPVPSRRKRSRVLRPNADTPGIVPATIQGLYGTPASPSLSSNVSQGVIEFLEASFSPTNLQTFGIEMGPNVAAPSSDHIVGKNDPNNPDNEADLDIQYIGSVGANVPNWFWLEPDSSWMYGFALHFFNTETVPTVISISYGYPEYFQCDPNIGNECSQYSFNNRTYVDRTNTEFQKIGLRGVSVVVASGDSGANGRLNGDCAIPRLHPDFPAASPFVTSVGATQLNSPQFSLNNAPMVCSGQGFACISSGDEVAATYDHASIVSGGGFSDYASRPSYQESVVSSYLSSGVELPPSSYFNSSGRAYPDLAAFGADILIFIGYVTPESGTSCASPIVAGAISLLNDYAISQSGKPLGFLNPLLYKMAAADSSTFSDITVGDNKCTEEGCGASCKGYVATTGWDPVTGLGSPQYPAMLSYLQKVFEARAGNL